jgi:hypothetical protein
LLIGRINRCREKPLVNPFTERRVTACQNFLTNQINMEIQGGHLKDGFKVRTDVSAIREGQKDKLN